MPFLRSIRPRSPRRGVTLVEMLVVVALLVLMMSVIVQVFTAATTAVSASRTYQELDSSLRQLDATLRGDLAGATARFTPPLNPKDNLGYFEYSENSFADAQGEDCDDYVRFTVKAPEGQPFTGRFYAVNPPRAPASPQAQRYYLETQPITITSQYAEVIYFLRNGSSSSSACFSWLPRSSGIHQRDQHRRAGCPRSAAATSPASSTRSKSQRGLFPAAA
ncbi:MAG: prepilin-type N-terminal cleavage/methylation domain-containing protein [Isosphaeraceae bacterium]